MSKEENMTLTWELLILQQTASLDEDTVTSIAEKSDKEIGGYSCYSLKEISLGSGYGSNTYILEHFFFYLPFVLRDLCESYLPHASMVVPLADPCGRELLGGSNV